MEHVDGDVDDDEDEGNTTTPFQPHYNSTPGPSGEEISMMTMYRGEEKGAKAAETFFIEGDSTYSPFLNSNKNAWKSLTGIYPEATAS